MPTVSHASSDAMNTSTSVIEHIDLSKRKLSFSSFSGSLHEGYERKDGMSNPLSSPSEDTAVTNANNDDTKCDKDDHTVSKEPGKNGECPTSESGTTTVETNTLDLLPENAPQTHLSNEYDNDPPRSFFWKTLTFWQRNVDIEIGTAPNSNTTTAQSAANSPNTGGIVMDNHTSLGTQDESERLPPEEPEIDLNIPGKVFSETKYVTTASKSPATVANASPTENLDIVSSSLNSLESPPQLTADSKNISVGQVETEETSTVIWGFTRRLSQLPAYLQTTPSVQVMTDQFQSDDTLQANGNNAVSSTNDATKTPLFRPSSSSSSEEELQPSWFKPWNWQLKRPSSGNEGSSIEPSTGMLEDELLKVQRKEVTNRIKLLSYGIPKSVTWGIVRTEGEKQGQVFITGSGYKHPISMEKLPVSMFEVNEQQLIKKNGNDIDPVPSIINDSIVLPEITWNYRNITISTKCRIALSKLTVLNSIFTPQNHLYVDNSQRKKKNSKRVVKKVIILSFHGFLPQKIVKNLLGECTYNSERMSELATKELQRWSSLNNIDLSVVTINLEGHGKLFERVNGCLSILDHFTDLLKTSDYLLAVSNSLNGPLAIHTISRLITSGYLDNMEKLGFVGFSSMCLGPLPEVESKISTRGSVGQDTEIISEIFDLEDLESLQSKELVRNLRVMIKKNFKISFIGSLTDCFTPLYSALCLNLTHPNIYRVIFIDGESNQPDFIISLLNLILTVKNLNYSDHGLLLELSKFFNGALGEGGHSKLMNNKYGYRIGINHMLNTSDLFYSQEMKEVLTSINDSATNTYHIPWCLRGFLEELSKLKRHFDVAEIMQQLYQEFRGWTPETQRMKDLKYCMGAFESIQHEDFGI